MDFLATNRRRAALAHARARRHGALLAGTLLAAALPVPVAAQLSLARPSSLSQAIAGAEFGDALAVGDLTGDGRDELVVGMPSREVAGSDYAGGVLIASAVEGSWQTTTITACGGLGLGVDRFMGAALAIADFDGDGFGDLAIGLPGQEVDEDGGAGAVCVVGGAATLAQMSFGAAQVLSQANLLGSVEAQDLVGASLAVGDVDRDGWVDLAIGAPGEDVLFDGAVYSGAGAVHVVFGGPGGLSPVDNRILTLEDNPWIEITSGASFGRSLAVGRIAGLFGHGVYVGAPGADVAGLDRAGGVIAWQFSGREPTVDYALRQGLTGTAGTPNELDGFGSALVLADFNSDGFEDLAVGVPRESGFGVAEAGGVNVLYGDAVAINQGADQMLLETVIDPLAVEAGDAFGAALAVGDFDLDGFDDLAIAAPGDNSLGVASSGEVTVVYGGPAGLSWDGHQVANMLFFGGQEVGERFGTSLAAGRFFEPHGGWDLAVGAPLRDTEANDAGWVTVIQSAVLFADGFEGGDLGGWSSHP